MIESYRMGRPSAIAAEGPPGGEGLTSSPMTAMRVLSFAAAAADIVWCGWHEGGR